MGEYPAIFTKSSPLISWFDAPPFFVYTAIAPPDPPPIAPKKGGRNTLIIATSLIDVDCIWLTSVFISLRKSEGVPPRHDKEAPSGPVPDICKPATFPCR